MQETARSICALNCILLASEVGPTRSTTSDAQGATNIQTSELTARRHFSELKKPYFLDTKFEKIRPSNEVFLN